MDLYQHFREQKLLSQIPSGKIVVAVSGGADSSALLHLLYRSRSFKKWDVLVAHIQHNLRGEESLRDQIFVERFCKRFELPLVVRTIQVRTFAMQNRKKGLEKRLGVEEASRILRYEALAKIGWENKARALFTAHTANDQAETFFLNLARGTGTAGLSGILPLRSLAEITGNQSRDSGTLLARPLLFASRKEILSYLKQQKLKFCNDRTNRNLKFRRNWVRHKLIPLLQKVQPKILEKISDFTAIFQREEEWKNLQLAKMEKRLFPKIKDDCTQRKRVLVEAKKTLDLDCFFRYDKIFIYGLLHRWFPQASCRTIDQAVTFLEKEKLKGKKKFYPISRRFFQNKPERI
ncbi:MAG: tRNA lysidine(34) synthetase TilS [Elusimicrobia bacterium RIFCSPLOWO2_02_FULL_39_32]|nr:MAG: tRNA lysidine(34) synthetase TilS [Elusimicrobia bacterium RIFCSPHIGHO2_02_FULL_39_36]OGR91753.1 MAG: tRNA lysidine(34) synthetase TilS [Elusimicrobia bacterium RIFCSPLOWO2_02_FULL_39_32]OGR98412.1 MAG: tRNA lysidine(34) synthetase TilS [Elusimicrobia bacterium RIFCSPLOWO2_12_FULL_39_28]